MKKNDVVDGSEVVLHTLLVMIELTMSHYATRTPYFVKLALLVTCVLGLIT